MDDHLVIRRSLFPFKKKDTITQNNKNRRRPPPPIIWGQKYLTSKRWRLSFPVYLSLSTIDVHLLIEAEDRK
jgi:hypothetical protein